MIRLGLLHAKIGRLLLGCLLASCAQVSAEPPSQEVHFQAPIYESDQHIELPAYLYRPEGPGPHPAIVDLHGCNGLWPIRSRPWITHYLEWGYAVLQVDSFTPRGSHNVCSDLFSIPTWQRALDAHAAKSWLYDQEWIDPDHIYLTGFSHGATTVLLALDGPLNARQPFAGATAFAPWCLDSLDNRHTDLMILIGGADQWTPAARCEVMQQTAPERLTLIVYDHVHHSFDAPGIDTHTQGYRVAHDAAATQDAVRQVRAFLKRLSGR